MRGKKNKTIERQSDRRVKYFIQMLDLKQDTNMTRVFSAIKQSDFLLTNKKITN